MLDGFDCLQNTFKTRQATIEEGPLNITEPWSPMHTNRATQAIRAFRPLPEDRWLHPSLVGHVVL